MNRQVVVLLQHRSVDQVRRTLAIELCAAARDRPFLAVTTPLSHSLRPVPDSGVDLAVDRANDLGIDAQDVGVDGPPVCRVRSSDYGPTSAFSVLPNGTPAAATTCSAACGDSAWPVYGPPNIDTALPYGACAADTPSCSTLAIVPCVCGTSNGPTHAFNCSCEAGTWICRIRFLGTALCMPCPDAGVSQIDQSSVSDGPQNAVEANQ